MESWTEKKTIYEGSIFDVSAGQARIHDGSIRPREVIDHNGGVAVAPFVDGKVILVRQYRIAIEKYILELPAGRLEGAENPEYRAHQELEEEIGYRADRLVHVASCYCSPGYTNELDHIYLGLDLEQTEARPEIEENIEIVELSLDEVRALLASHSLDDAKTIIGLHELLIFLDGS